MESKYPSDADLEINSREEPVNELIALGIPGEVLSALAPAIAATRLHQYISGDTIYHEGTDVEALYVIVNGRVKLLNYLEGGHARIIRLHTRGSILGLNGLIDEPYTNSAVASDDVAVYQIPIHLIKVLKEEDPATYSKLLEYWYEYLKMADIWITDFSTGTIRGRVARLLKFLVDSEEENGYCHITALPGEEMGEILGVTPESISRTMAELKRKKIIQTIDGESHYQYQCKLKRLMQEAEK